jgi:hypothetical protein
LDSLSRTIAADHVKLPSRFQGVDKRKALIPLLHHNTLQRHIFFIILTQHHNKHRTHFHENKGVSWAWWLMPAIPATRKTKIRRIMVQGPSGQKVSKIPISINNLSMMVCACDSRHR